MLHPKLINPASIVVVGGSDHLDHLGGSVLKNLIDQKFKGKLFVVNPKKDVVQGLTSYRNIEDIPEVDLAIIAIAAPEIPAVIQILTKKKNTKGFIIYSSGFGELNEDGEKLEQEICSMIDEAGGSLLGPNNIGMLNENYAGVFTRPIPKLNPKGVDFISGSGATAVFTIEAAQQIGLTFSGLYTVGNSTQIGIEEILVYLDLSYIDGKSSTVKMLYLEGIKNPDKFLKHCRSLKQKGCEIIALKAGNSEEGTKAASSHTGAMASSNLFIQALFNKAGIIRCYSRYELINTAGIAQLTRSRINNFAIITHAGGPGVVLTDALCNNGLKVPGLSHKHQKHLLGILYSGASAKNPVDILATGTAEQLDQVIQYCDESIDEVEAMIVIFGSPGLGSVKEAYQVISDQSKKCRKPVFAILPSVINVKEDIKSFIEQGNLSFYDEHLFGECLSKVMKSKTPPLKQDDRYKVNETEIRKLIDESENGFLDPLHTFALLEASGIKTVDQFLVSTETELLETAKTIHYPVVQKAAGLLHKTDQRGVILNVSNTEELFSNYHKLRRIPGAKGIIIQEMIEGKEIFIGTKKEPGFPPLILCGAGGIYVEIVKDIACALAPISAEESIKMIESLSVFPILKGARGEQGIDIKAFSDVIVKLSHLVLIAPEIAEIDVNPLKANAHGIVAVDARIRIQK
jgi:acyl-CoA synthetase (NDP forming)